MLSNHKKHRVGYFKSQKSGKATSGLLLQLQILLSSLCIALSFTTQAVQHSESSLSPDIINLMNEINENVKRFDQNGKDRSKKGTSLPFVYNASLSSWEIPIGATPELKKKFSEVGPSTKGNRMLFNSYSEFKKWLRGFASTAETTNSDEECLMLIEDDFVEIDADRSSTPTLSSSSSNRSRKNSHAADLKDDVKRIIPCSTRFRYNESDDSSKRSLQSYNSSYTIKEVKDILGMKKGKQLNITDIFKQLKKIKDEYHTSKGLACDNVTNKELRLKYDTTKDESFFSESLKPHARENYQGEGATRNNINEIDLYIDDSFCEVLVFYMQEIMDDLELVLKASSNGEVTDAAVMTLLSQKLGHSHNQEHSQICESSTAGVWGEFTVNIDVEINKFRDIEGGTKSKESVIVNRDDLTNNYSNPHEDDKEIISSQDKREIKPQNIKLNARTKTGEDIQVISACCTVSFSGVAMLRLLKRCIDYSHSHQSNEPDKISISAKQIMELSNLCFSYMACQKEDLPIFECTTDSDASNGRLVVDTHIYNPEEFHKELLTLQKLTAVLDKTGFEEFQPNIDAEDSNSLTGPDDSFSLGGSMTFGRTIYTHSAYDIDPMCLTDDQLNNSFNLVNANPFKLLDDMKGEVLKVNGIPSTGLTPEELSRFQKAEEEQDHETLHDLYVELKAKLCLLTDDDIYAFVNGEIDGLENHDYETSDDEENEGHANVSVEEKTGGSLNNSVESVVAGSLVTSMTDMRSNSENNEGALQDLSFKISSSGNTREGPENDDGANQDLDRKNILITEESSDAKINSDTVQSNVSTNSNDISSDGKSGTSPEGSAEVNESSETKPDSKSLNLEGNHTDSSSDGNTHVASDNKPKEDTIYLNTTRTSDDQKTELRSIKRKMDDKNDIDGLSNDIASLSSNDDSVLRREFINFDVNDPTRATGIHGDERGIPLFKGLPGKENDQVSDMSISDDESDYEKTDDSKSDTFENLKAEEQAAYILTIPPVVKNSWKLTLITSSSSDDSFEDECTDKNASPGDHFHVSSPIFKGSVEVAENEISVKNAELSQGSVSDTSQRLEDEHDLKPDQRIKAYTDSILRGANGNDSNVEQTDPPNMLYKTAGVVGDAVVDLLGEVNSNDKKESSDTPEMDVVSVSHGIENNDSNRTKTVRFINQPETINSSNDNYTEIKSGFRTCENLEVQVDHMGNKKENHTKIPSCRVEVANSQPQKNDGSYITRVGTRRDAGNLNSNEEKQNRRNNYEHYRKTLETFNVDNEFYSDITKDLNYSFHENLRQRKFNAVREDSLIYIQDWLNDYIERLSDVSDNTHCRYRKQRAETMKNQLRSFVKAAFQDEYNELTSRQLDELSDSMVKGFITAVELAKRFVLEKNGESSNLVPRRDDIPRNITLSCDRNDTKSLDLDTTFSTETVGLICFDGALTYATEIDKLKIREDEDAPNCLTKEQKVACLKNGVENWITSCAKHPLAYDSRISIDMSLWGDEGAKAETTNESRTKGISKQFDNIAYKELDHAQREAEFRRVKGVELFGLVTHTFLTNNIKEEDSKPNYLQSQGEELQTQNPSEQINESFQEASQLYQQINGKHITILHSTLDSSISNESLNSQGWKKPAELMHGEVWVEYREKVVAEKLKTKQGSNTSLNAPSYKTNLGKSVDAKQTENQNTQGVVVSSVNSLSTEASTKFAPPKEPQTQTFDNLTSFTGELISNEDTFASEKLISLVPPISTIPNDLEKDLDLYNGQGAENTATTQKLDVSNKTLEVTQDFKDFVIENEEETLIVLAESGSEKSNISDNGDHHTSQDPIEVVPGLVICDTTNGILDSSIESETSSNEQGTIKVNESGNNASFNSTHENSGHAKTTQAPNPVSATEGKVLPPQTDSLKNKSTSEGESVHNYTYLSLTSKTVLTNGNGNEDSDESSSVTSSSSSTSDDCSWTQTDHTSSNLKSGNPDNIDEPSSSHSSTESIPSSSFENKPSSQSGFTLKTDNVNMTTNDSLVSAKKVDTNDDVGVHKWALGTKTYVLGSSTSAYKKQSLASNGMGGTMKDSNMFNSSSHPIQANTPGVVISNSGGLSSHPLSPSGAKSVSSSALPQSAATNHDVVQPTTSVEVLVNNALVQSIQASFLSQSAARNNKLRTIMRTLRDGLVSHTHMSDANAKSLREALKSWRASQYAKDVSIANMLLEIANKVDTLHHK